MSLYGIAGLFMSSYLWCTMSLNIGSGYDLFDRKEGIVCIFRWRFPGKNRRIFLRFSSGYPVNQNRDERRSLSSSCPEIRGQGAIPLTRTD
jgi:hypothetical protein